SPDPEHAFIIRWTVGVQPEACGSPGPGLLGPREAQGPEPDVVALARAVVDRLLEPNVLGAAEQIECAERGGRIGRVEREGPDHTPGAGAAAPVGLRPREGG